MHGRQRKHPFIHLTVEWGVRKKHVSEGCDIVGRESEGCERSERVGRERGESERMRRARERGV